MARGPLGIAGAIVGWVLVVGIVVAIMVIWNWDPVAFISNSIGRISDFFLQWEWFRNLVGAP